MPKFEIISKDFYSNCLIEAIKAKIKNPKIKITIVMPWDNEVSCPHILWNVELNLVKIAYTKNINKLKEYISDEFRPQKYYTQILEIDKIILNNFRFRNEIVKYCNVEWKGSQMKLLGVKEEFDE